MKIIKTKQFILRPFQRGDAPSMQRNIDNKIIHRNTLRLPYPYTLKDAEKWVRKNIREEKKPYTAGFVKEEMSKKQRKMFNFIIEINGEAAGSVGLSSIHFPRAELAYWLAEQFWGQGIMTEAVGFTTEFGLKELKLRRIFAGVFPYNKASVRVLEKNHYKLEGILRKNLVKNRKVIDEYVFARVK